MNATLHVFALRPASRARRLFRIKNGSVNQITITRDDFQIRDSLRLIEIFQWQMSSNKTVHSGSKHVPVRVLEPEPIRFDSPEAAEPAAAVLLQFCCRDGPTERFSGLRIDRLSVEGKSWSRWKEWEALMGLNAALIWESSSRSAARSSSSIECDLLLLINYLQPLSHQSMQNSAILTLFSPQKKTIK